MTQTMPERTTALQESILCGKPVVWRDRIWISLTDAMPRAAMYVHLSGHYFPFDHETAAEMACGGAFDVTCWPEGAANGKFTTYMIMRAGALVRLYRATGTRELRDGRTW